MKKRLLVWWMSHRAIILYHARSVVQSFLTGVSLYLYMNWGMIKDVNFDRAALVGLVVAMARSGVKAVWMLAEPQILKIIKTQAKV